MKKNKSLYEILGVNEDSSQEEIRKAYRESSKRFHPDMPEGSQEKFVEINQAYSTLGDESKRKRYDETGEYEGSKVKEPDFMEIVEMNISEFVIQTIRGVHPKTAKHIDFRQQLIVRAKGSFKGLTQEVKNIKSQIETCDTVIKGFGDKDKSQSIKDILETEKQRLKVELRQKRLLKAVSRKLILIFSKTDYMVEMKQESKMFPNQLYYTLTGTSS